MRTREEVEVRVPFDGVVEAAVDAHFVVRAQLYMTVKETQIEMYNKGK